jgi:hypothetical protein
MDALDHPSFCIIPIQHGVHRIDDAWVFQYVHAGNSAEFTVVSEAPFLVERGFPRFRAKLPNSFKEGGACEETLRWRVDATRRVADYLRRDQVWSPAAIDLSDLESFDGYRPSRVIW